MISTDVVNDCTAKILKTGCVADEAEGCHLAGDLKYKLQKLFWNEIQKSIEKIAECNYRNKRLERS